jgi:LEA14-like dessication related protein
MDLKPILFGGVILAAIGVGLWVYYNFKAALMYCYTLTNLSVSSVSNDEIDMSIGVMFQNNSDIDININSCNLDIYVNGILLANLNRNMDFNILPSTTQTINLPIKVKNDNVMKGWAKVISALSYYYISPNNLKIRVNGRFSGVILGLIPLKNYPIDIEMSYAEMTSPSATDKICEGFRNKNKGKLTFNIK